MLLILAVIVLYFLYEYFSKKAPLLITPHIFTIEHANINPNFIFHAIENTIKDLDLTGVYTRRVNLKEGEGFFGISKRRMHLQVNIGFNISFVVYVAPYANRWTLIGMRRYVDVRFDYLGKLVRSNRSAFPEDVKDFRLRVIRDKILQSIENSLDNHGERPAWIKESGEIKMKASPKAVAAHA